MRIKEIKLKVSDILKEMEKSGDIVIISTPEVLAEKIIQPLGKNVENLLSEGEFGAVLNCLNVLVHNVQLDNRDFQTIIGLEKDELKSVLDKLYHLRVQ